MTLNQVIKRLQTIVESHNQVRRYQLGLAEDEFLGHTSKYPAVLMQYVNGTISTSAHVSTLNFRMLVVDIVHVSQDSKENENEVLSDMLSIILDLISQINHPSYNDWRITGSNNADVVIEGGDDMYAGWAIDFSISTQFVQNVCEVPSDLIIEVIETETDKPMYDKEYIATGAEGTTLNIAEIVGKKVLLVIRETIALHKVSSAPDSIEYIWNNTTIELGAAVGGAGERFLILYRNN